MLHSGVDLHKRTVVIATVDAAGQRVREAQLPTTRAALSTYFAGLPGGAAQQRAVVESTATWYWLRDCLVGDGVDLRLGHSKHIKAISYARVKTDAVDAATLAQLLRGDLVPEAHMVSPEWREARDLLRARLQLVRNHVRCQHIVTGLLAQYNETTIAALPALVRLRVELIEAQRTLLAGQAKQLARALDPRLLPNADVQRLLWIPGIGRLLAFTIWLEIDGIGRFPSARDFVSYCRLVPGAGNSGGKVRHKRTKDGNRYLKLAFHHAAVRAIQYCPEIRAYAQALRRRKPAPVARALVAKELARIVFYVLTKQEAFNGTFNGKPLSRTKQRTWPRRASPAVKLAPCARERSPARG